MALPEDMKLVLVKIGPATDFAGQVIVGGRVTITPSASITWANGGVPLFARPILVPLDENGMGQILLPATDQDGFIDDHGRSIKNWTYTVEWAFDERSVKVPAKHQVQLLSTLDEVDLDTLSPVTGSTGVTVSLPAVISVNGRTGAIDISDLLPVFAVDEVNTLPPGSPASVELSDGRFSFGIPGSGVIVPGDASTGDIATVESGELTYKNPADVGLATTASLDDAVGKLKTTVVSTRSDLASVDSAVEHARTVDLFTDWLRDAPGGDWRRTDAGLHVPEYFSDANDPAKLARALKGFADASRAYQASIQRTSLAATSSQPGLFPRAQGVGPELVLNPNQEWYIAGQPGTYNVGLQTRIPIFTLTAACQVIHGNGAAIVCKGLGDAAFGITTRYRLYDDDPIRANGDASPWSMGVVADQNTYFSGGRGSGNTVEWRYAKAAQAVITADVGRGETTVQVDNVDGVDRNWFAAKGVAVPAALEAAKLTVGSVVTYAQGMNPADAHERKAFAIGWVVAINGTETPGYTTTGPGTITLSEPFEVDMRIAEQRWSFPVKSGTYHLDPNGPDNTESHSIWSVNLDYLCTNVQLDDLTFLRDPSYSGKAPSAWISLQSVYGPQLDNIRAFDSAQEIVNHNQVKRGRIGRLELLGRTDTAGGNSNAGMAFDACTSQVEVAELIVRGYTGPVHQSESYAKTRIHKAFIDDTHPKRRAGTSKQMSKALFLVSSADLAVDELRWNSGSSQWLANVSGGADSSFEIRREAVITVTSTDGTKRPRLNGTDFGPGCRVTYSGGNLAGTANETFKLSPRRREPTILLSYAPSATAQVALPPGLIGGGEITLPADITDMTALYLWNPAGSSLWNKVSLFGTNVTDATNAAVDTVGDGYGSDLDRTITSAGGKLSADLGDLVVWPGGNEDGTAWTATVIDATHAPNSVVVDQMLPRPLASGTLIRLGDVALAGKTVKLPRAGFGFTFPSATNKQNFNLGKLEAEEAGGTTYLVAQFGPAANVGAGQAVRLDLDVFPRTLALGATAPFTRPVVPPKAPGQSQYTYIAADLPPVNNSTAVVATPLSLPLEPNAVYEFAATVIYDSDSTTDMKLSWNYPAGASGRWSSDAYITTIGAGVTSGQVDRSATAGLSNSKSVGGLGVGAGAIIHPNGMIQTGSTGGNLTLCYTQTTAGPFDTVIRALSNLRVTRVG